MERLIMPLRPGDGYVSKVPAAQAKGPKFRSQCPCKKAQERCVEHLKFWRWEGAGREISRTHWPASLVQSVTSRSTDGPCL